MEQTLITTSFLFVANFLYALSYTLRDILWLRLLAVVAAASTVPYFYFQAEPLYSAIFWQGTFLLINIVHAVILIIERRPVHLTEEEARLHTLVFSTLKPRTMLKLLNVATWKTAQPGDVLIEEGDPPDHLILIYNGKVKVAIQGSLRAVYLSDGQFAGEMGMLAGQSTSATLEVVEETRYLHWDISELNYLFQKKPELQEELKSILGLDMASKLRMSNVSRAPQPA